MAERSSIFDMIGPVMIGPSSSHTAGVARIGRVARKILERTPEKITVTFFNSFATTFEGHGSDRAVVAGLLDMNTDDPNLKEALEIAKQANIETHFRSVISDSRLHPNTLIVQAGAKEKEIEVMGISRGGGLIQIVQVNGFTAQFTAQLHTLFITAKDIRGSIAFITSVLANDDCNIATMSVSRKARHETAGLILEIDSPVRDTTIAYLKTLNWVNELVYFAPVA
jgi:L-serine dehydratase